MSGGGSGAASPEGGGADEWRRIFDRVEALLPRVEEIAADRARSRTHQESSEARENALHARLLQAEASRRRWKAAYMELPPGANPKLAELQENDLVDSKACEGLFYAGGSEPEIQQEESRNDQQLSQNNEDGEYTARDLRAELSKLKQAYGTMSSKKDREVSELLVVKNFLWNQLRTMDKDNTALLKMKEMEAAQATEAAQKVQQNVVELQMAARNKDAEIDRLRAEAANAKTRVLVLDGKLLEMQSLVKEKSDEIQKLKSGQPESLKCKCASSVSNGSTSFPSIWPAHTKPWFLFRSIQQEESRNDQQLSQNNEDGEDTARDLRAELSKLKQAYGTMSSKKDREVSELLVVKNFLWNQLRTMDKDNTALLKTKEVEVAQATEAAQKVLQNVEELQLAARNKDAEIDRMRAEAADAKTRVLILEGKLLKMQSLVKEKKDEIQKLKSGQPKSLKLKNSNETSQKRRKLTNEMHLEQCTTRNKSEGCNLPDTHSLAKKHQVSLKCWLMLLEHEDMYRYIPQCGDEVMYLRQGHEEYLNGIRLCDICPWDQIKGLKDVELCRIEGLGYTTYEESGESCCILALKFIDDTSRGFGKQFIITLLELFDCADFLVERTRFEAAIVQNWTITDKCKVRRTDDREEGGSWLEGQVMAIRPKSPDFPESPWDKYVIRYEDYASDHLHSPWELHAADSPLVPWKHPHIDSSIRNKLLSAVTTLQKMSHKNQDYYGVLKLDTVAGKSDFINSFPVQFSIEVIRARLHNDYYRTLDAVQHDATLMVSNAKSYFSKSSEMTKKILRLSEWVKDNIQSL